MIFQSDQKIVFAGDSITDCGRRDRARFLGNGYVAHLHDFVTAQYPALRLNWINRGVSGDTVRDLAARWDRDVLAERPNWVSIMIGINDVWRAFGNNTFEAVPLPEYERTLRELLEQARARGARLIMMTPYMIEADRHQLMRRQMDWYSEAVRRLARELEAVLVDTQAAFDHVLRDSTPHDWADDQIHPDSAGHAVIALAWLRAVGFELHQ